jgi:hypothetical protein
LPGAWIGALKLNRSRRPVQDFVERHQNVALNVLSALGERRSIHAISPRAVETTAWTTPARKELLEEITEARAVEMVFGTVCGTPAESVLRLRCLSFGMIPIRSQFVILFPFLRVAENFIRLVEFLEVFLSGFLVFGDIGMVLSGEFAERLFDRFSTCVSMHAENLVIILEFNGHYWLPSDGPHYSL